MKANELRIGNYYKVGNVVAKVDWETIYELTKQSLNTIHFHPIPLTEEILLKCGFENKIEDESTSFFKYINPLNGFTTIEVCLSDSCVWLDLMQINIKHLHQLQNLYFALTGEELNIEL